MSKSYHHALKKEEEEEEEKKKEKLECNQIVNISNYYTK